MTFHGPRFIQIDTPCPSAWSFPSHLTLEIGRLGVNCGLVPLFEIENGRLTKVRKLKNKLPVSDYLKGQKRYRHLFGNQPGRNQLQELQEVADQNIEKYGLLPRSE